MGSVLLRLLLALQQPAIPAPRGYVNDFAGVLDAASISHMEAVITEVREKTGGEIAVVTLADLQGREASDVAVQIGRQWGVGRAGEAGDPKKNLGVVVLLMPRQNHKPGSGQLFIATGRGAEGFLPDARVGRIRDEMGPALADEDYGRGLAQGVDLIAQAFAQQFGVTITGAPLAPAPEGSPGFGGIPIPLIIILVLLLLFSRGRFLWLPFWFGGFGGGRRGGWGGGGGGGGGFGGFGGFGGGGGFSGGGAGGRF